MRSAYPRQGSRTAHVAQMALACSSRLSFSLFRSKCDGGKKTAAWGPRHAARTCQASSTRCALTDTPPFSGGPYSRALGQTRKVFRLTERGVGTLPVVSGLLMLSNGLFHGVDV